ncbi:MAG: hypothetical protein HY445_00270 [Candidatus Niyogibacteria bacterium]|nr:hypothetical protein [Candidatus Niyogibacteria bacterium]
MPLYAAEITEYKQSLLSRLFRGKKKCVCCNEQNPDIKVVAHFGGTFIPSHSVEKHLAHEDCLEKGRFAVTAFPNPEEQHRKTARAIFHYQVALGKESPLPF